LLYLFVLLFSLGGQSRRAVRLRQLDFCRRLAYGSRGLLDELFVNLNRLRRPIGFCVEGSESQSRERHEIGVAIGGHRLQLVLAGGIVTELSRGHTQEVMRKVGRTGVRVRVDYGLEAFAGLGGALGRGCKADRTGLLRHAWKAHRGIEHLDTLTEI